MSETDQILAEIRDGIAAVAGALELQAAIAAIPLVRSDSYHRDLLRAVIEETPEGDGPLAAIHAEIMTYYR